MTSTSDASRSDSDLPASVSEHVDRAVAAERAGHVHDALDAYDFALVALVAAPLAPEERATHEAKIHYSRATLYRFSGELPRALDELNECVRRGEEADQQFWQVRAIRARGEIFLRQKMIGDAVTAFEQAAEICEKSGDVFGALLTCSRLSRAVCDAGRMDDAMQLCEAIFREIQSGALPNRTEQNTVAAQCYLTLGVICFRRGMARRSRRFFERAVEAIQEAGLQLPLAEARRFLGILQSEAKNFRQAMPHLCASLRIYSSLGYDPGRFDAYLSLGTTYLEMGDLKNSRLCLSQAEQIAQTVGLGPELGKARSRLADLELREGNYEAALQMYIEDLELTVKTSDRQALGFCHRNLARTYLLMGDTQKASTHAHQAIEHFTATGRPHLAASTDLHLAEALLQNGNVEEARRQLDNSREALAKHGRQADLTWCQFVDARILRHENRLQEARQVLEECIEAQLRQPPDRMLAETRYECALVCRDLGDLLATADHLANAVGLAESLGSRDIRKRALSAMEGMDVAGAQKLKLAPYLPSGAVDELSRVWVDIDKHKETTMATVMFVDMRGFTTLSGDVADIDLVATVEAFLSLVVRIVRQNGGSVDKFIGDCVMGTFGLGQEPEQGARMAVWAGLEMIEQLRSTSEVRRAAGAGVLEGSIGINTGTVMAGCFGPLEKRDYTVVGYHVNLASRLQSLASVVAHNEPNRMILSDSTYSAAKSIVAARELRREELTMKGIDVESVRGWLVTGARVAS